MLPNYKNNAPRKHHLSKPQNDFGTQILKLQRFQHLYEKYVVYTTKQFLICSISQTQALQTSFNLLLFN